MVGAAVIGVVAGAVCSFAGGWKFRFGYDDSLDVVGVHLVGGVVAPCSSDCWRRRSVTGGVEGLFYGGGFAQLGKQVLAVAVVGLYAFGSRTASAS